jgi:hypothetical protein
MAADKPEKLSRVFTPLTRHSNIDSTLANVETCQVLQLNIRLILPGTSKPDRSESQLYWREDYSQLYISAFQVEKEFFSPQTASIPGQGAILANYPVTWNNNCDSVHPISISDRPDCPGLSNRFRLVEI